MNENSQKKLNTPLASLLEDIYRYLETGDQKNEELRQLVARIEEQYQLGELSIEDMQEIATSLRMSLTMREKVSQLPEVTVPEREYRKLQQQLDKIKQQDRRELDTQPKTSIVPDRGMKIGEGIQPTIAAPPLAPTAPSIQLWNAIELINSQAAEQGKPLLEGIPLSVLNIYLTRQISMRELKPLAGVRTKQGVQDQLRRSMRKVFPHLPEEVQAEFETPENALRVRAGKHTELSLQRLKQGLDRLRRPDTNKIEFSDTHKQHLTEGNLRRWKRHRETQQAETQQNQP